MILALGHLFEIENILLILAGVVGGIIVGALPGLTATMAIALLVPFTFTMNATSGLITLGAIYCGAIYGGCFSAILIGTPGTPSAIATVFDGYPMARKGEAEEAIVTATGGFGGRRNNRRRHAAAAISPSCEGGPQIRTA